MAENADTAQLDHINRLLQFDTNGSGCDTAMALMRRHGITAVQLNDRRRDPQRNIYRPF